MFPNFINDNFLTIWIQQKWNQFATDRALEVIQKTGRALPCSVVAVNGAMVTVNFEVTGPWTLPQLTLPKQEAQWSRMPTQVGDVGITIPADTFLGGISGVGTGVANMQTDYGNLSTLVWVPCGTTSFPAMPNPNAGWFNGPDGAYIGDTAQTTISIYDPTGKAISHIVPTGGYVGIGALASSLSTTNNAAQRYVDQVAFAASIKQMVGNALQQAAQAAIASGVTNATAWLASIQSGLPSLTFTNLTSSIASLSAPAGSAKVLIE